MSCRTARARCRSVSAAIASLDTVWVRGPSTNTREQKPFRYALTSSVPCPRGRRLTPGRAQLRSPWSQDHPRSVCKKEAQRPALSCEPMASRRSPSSGFPRGSWPPTESSREAFAAVLGSTDRRWSCEFNRIFYSPGPFRRLHKYLKQNLQRALSEIASGRSSLSGTWFCLWLGGLWWPSGLGRETGLCLANSEPFGDGKLKAAKGELDTKTH